MSQPFNKVLLSTGNIMEAGVEVIRRPASEKSNLELVNSLKESFESAASAVEDPDVMPITNGDSLHVPGNQHNEPNFQSWTSVKDGIFHIPNMSGMSEPLGEDRDEYDITVKLFYLPRVPPQKRCKQTDEAMALVLHELNVSNVDLLILSFPGISFDADDDASEDEPSVDPVDEWSKAYEVVERLHSAGKVKKIGLAEFGTARLAKLLPKTKIRPAVDQINVRDCCVVPKPLIIYARKEGIELLTHNDCTDIMPSGTLRRLLTNEVKLVGKEREMHPQFVVKYTAVVKDRGVVENKGYFVVAEVD